MPSGKTRRFPRANATSKAIYAAPVPDGRHFQIAVTKFALLHANKIAPASDPARAILRRLSCSCGNVQTTLVLTLIGFADRLESVEASAKVKIVVPSVRETAFNCPHCFAYTTQYWYKLLANSVNDEKRLPFVVSASQRDNIAKNSSMPSEEKKSLLTFLDEMLTGLVFVDPKEGKYGNYPVRNLHLSECYNCKKIAVWVADRLLFPAAKAGVSPNPDLPDDIRGDFEEAREIVQASPRGAAAMLRLAVQKLCAHLGEKGRNIDEDIASLVRKGLNPIVQQALDIVRVIGNEAVHPGVLDFRDDRDSAFRLFELLNAIADQMITHPKTVGELYGKLPEKNRKAIEKRDAQ